MKNSITKRQKELLGFIYKHIEDAGYPPTFEEMKEKLNVSSNQSIIDFLTKLEERKLIKREEGQARGMKILSAGFQALGMNHGVPFAGTSSAGPYTESYNDIFDKWVPLPNDKTQKDSIMQLEDDVFVIQVRGDSMINAGINDGDMLLIKKSKEFKSGDIVVARSDDGTTVKRFIAEGGKRYLKPENPAYENIPIIPGEIRFEGKVIFNLTTKMKIV